MAVHCHTIAMVLSRCVRSTCVSWMVGAWRYPRAAFQDPTLLSLVQAIISSLLMRVVYAVFIAVVLFKLLTSIFLFCLRCFFFTTVLSALSCNCCIRFCRIRFCCKSPACLLVFHKFLFFSAISTPLSSLYYSLCSFLYIKNLTRALFYILFVRCFHLQNPLSLLVRTYSSSQA
ncbi:hypothetical protein BX070DRAFT_76352 [Coemansia spiralis]|nr:hypothetical protein BX070DRAFT_76352 [Coemansia spiralis]